MSTLKTGALRGTSGTADSIQLHASNQSVTFPGDVTCSGTATGFGSAGVTEADLWTVTADYSAGDVSPLSANIARQTTSATSAPLGTGMSVSSGIWTFPSTGWWDVTAYISFKLPADTASDYSIAQIKSTVNNSSYTTIAEAYAHSSSINTENYSTASVSVLLDITDTSNQKISFHASVQNNNLVVMGHADAQQTYFKFVKLAAT
tara:strand:+ start:374 stop:988 length:615 start_codon:yes stop_codon:yes gene_type:complete